MIPIQKIAAPAGLEELQQKAREHGLSDKEAYDTLSNPLKEEVRQSLMREQGHLCAYCMRALPDARISSDDPDYKGIYIEHWVPRSPKTGVQTGLALDYGNLLAVCSGGQKPPAGDRSVHRGSQKTCDAKRGNTLLTVNPLDPETLSTIYYTADGKIAALDPNIHRDLVQTLNLNCIQGGSVLPEERKRVLEEVQMEIALTVNTPEEFQACCREQLAFWEEETDPKTPFVGIILWWLRDQLAET